MSQLRENRTADDGASRRAESDSRPLHTGQHYDARMKDAFFTQRGIPEPDVDWGVGSASHVVQTAEIMRRFEPALDQEKPAAVWVVGDVNSTIACALAAAKKDVPVIHVEAGLRSYDRRMPEEINRVLTDQISDLLFITERSARDNLMREGVDERRIHFVGNVMIDAIIGRAMHYIARKHRAAYHGQGGDERRCRLGSCAYPCVSRGVLSRDGKAGRIPELWDGKASQRIKSVLFDWLARGHAHRRAAGRA